MEFFKKIFGFFKKTKETVYSIELKVQAYVNKNKKNIRLLITIFEAMFPEQTGAKKMACLVTDVCAAIGLKNLSEDIVNLVEAKCQEVYDEFKASLN